MANERPKGDKTESHVDFWGKIITLRENDLCKH